jgi:hypothetical protein
MEQVLKDEIQRFRWRRARLTAGLVDGSDEGEAWNPYGFEEAPMVRFLVLASDPSRDVVEFDDGLWKYFGEVNDPINGGNADWGREDVPTSNAALRASGRPGKRLARYLAVMRHGGLEMGLGNDAAYQDQEGIQWFRLLLIVGRVWSALSAYDRLRQLTHERGPWELTLALRNTKGAGLNDFAQGWEPASSWNQGPRCFASSLRRTVEIASWPEEDEVEDLAMQFGRWLEDSFGSKQRRFISRYGDLAGEFDASRYRWY